MTASVAAIQLLNRQALTPVLIGTGTVAAGAGSLGVTLTGPIPSGSQVFVAVTYGKSTAITVSTVGDGGTNTYAQVRTQAWDVNTFAAFDLWQVINANALASGTVTITFNTTTSNLDSIAHVFYVNGTQRQTGINDVSASTSTGASSTATPSSGATSTLAQSSEFVLGFFGGYGSAATNPDVSSESSGFTAFQNTISGARYVLHTAYKFQNNSTAANTYAPTINTSTFLGSTMVATFRA